MADCRRPGGRLVRQRLDRHCASNTGHAIHNSLLKKVFLIQQHIEYTLNISNNYLIKKNIILIIEFTFGLENLIVDHYAQVIGRYEQEAAALDEPTYYFEETCMISETIETYSKKHFDYNGHIAIFLHTSAVYLDVSERQTIPATVELVMPSHQHTEV